MPFVFKFVLAAVVVTCPILPTRDNSEEDVPFALAAAAVHSIAQDQLHKKLKRKPHHENKNAYVCKKKENVLI